jgi:HAD superfamily hydrolase (TIGR01490 family)
MEPISSAESSPSKSYIVFFDLDQTLTKSISGKALVKTAYKKGLMSSYDLLHALFLTISFRLKFKSPLMIIDAMISWVKGIPEKTMTELCSEVFHESLLPSVYEGARSEVEDHRAKNAKIVILSSALTTICEEMAASLDIDDYICSRLEVKNGFMTGHPLGRLCFGEEKATRLKDYCANNNFSASDAWYYGDSISDLPALYAVGNPICVNPDRKLRKIAGARHWQVRSWKA